jgi:hypothetical protein
LKVRFLPRSPFLLITCDLERATDVAFADFHPRKL